MTETERERAEHQTLYSIYYIMKSFLADNASAQG